MYLKPKLITWSFKSVKRFQLCIYDSRFQLCIHFVSLRFERVQDSVKKFLSNDSRYWELGKQLFDGPDHRLNKNKFRKCVFFQIRLK